MADINNLDLNQEIDVGEVSAEQFFSINLPDDGPHTVIMRLSAKQKSDLLPPGFEVARQREGGKKGTRTGPYYLTVNVQLFKYDPTTGEESGTLAFDTLTSIVMPTGGTRLHAALDAAGCPIPSKASITAWIEAVQAALAQNPRVVAHTRWEAQINRGSQDSPDYKTIAKGQAAFPKYEGSEKHNPEITDPQTGQTVNAQVRVYKYTRVE